MKAFGQQAEHVGLLVQPRGIGGQVEIVFPQDGPLAADGRHRVPPQGDELAAVIVDGGGGGGPVTAGVHRFHVPQRGAVDRIVFRASHVVEGAAFLAHALEQPVQRMPAQAVRVADEQRVVRTHAPFHFRHHVVHVELAHPGFIPVLGRTAGVGASDDLRAGVPEQLFQVVRKLLLFQVGEEQHLGLRVVVPERDEEGYLYLHVDGMDQG